MRMSTWHLDDEHGYPPDVPIGRSAPEKTPVPYLEEKDRYQNLWVAVKDGRIIAVAETSRALVYELHKLGPRGEDAVAEYVRPASAAYIVGVG